MGDQDNRCGDVQVGEDRASPKRDILREDRSIGRGATRSDAGAVVAHDACAAGDGGGNPVPVVHLPAEPGEKDHGAAVRSFDTGGDQGLPGLQQQILGLRCLESHDCAREDRSEASPAAWPRSAFDRKGMHPALDESHPRHRDVPHAVILRHRSAPRSRLTRPDAYR